MKPSQNCIELIIKYEGFEEKAYACPANVPTIGYGTTRYPDGRKVQYGETITKTERIMIYCLAGFEKQIQEIYL